MTKGVIDKYLFPLLIGHPRAVEFLWQQRALRNVVRVASAEMRLIKVCPLG